MNEHEIVGKTVGAQIVPRDYHDIIAKVASVKDVDVEKLERLMKLQEEWDKRQAAIRYNDMMALAQGEMTQISRDSANTQTRSRYASLEALDEAIRPIYTKYGFSVEFNEEHPGERADGVVLAIYVSCGAETRRRAKYIPITTTGFKGTTMMTPTHASIGAVTYGRRALLKMVFNLAEVDTDGDLKKFDEIESGASQQQTENPAPPADDKKAPNIDAIIAEMRRKPNHTALYAYKEGYVAAVWKQIADADRERLKKEYEVLMLKFKDQQK